MNQTNLITIIKDSIKDNIKDIIKDNIMDNFNDNFEDNFKGISNYLFISDHSKTVEYFCKQLNKHDRIAWGSVHMI